jgi:hypothetical protein
VEDVEHEVRVELRAQELELGAGAEHLGAGGAAALSRERSGVVAGVPDGGERGVDEVVDEQLPEHDRERQRPRIPRREESAVQVDRVRATAAVDATRVVRRGRG